MVALSWRMGKREKSGDLGNSLTSRRCSCHFNTLRPRQIRRHFPDYISKCIFLNENVWILIEISLKYVPEDSINNIAALVQIMAWRRPGDKPLSELMTVSLSTHICVTRPQWVKKKIIFKLSWWIDILSACCENVRRMLQNSIDDKSTLVQVMAWCRQAPSHYLNQCWPRSPKP